MGYLNFQIAFQIHFQHRYSSTQYICYSARYTRKLFKYHKSSPFSAMSQKIDLSKLEPQQLVEIRLSTEKEIEHFTSSLQALQTVQSKLQDCVRTIDNMQQLSSSELLVPMTSSLYLPGHIKERDQYLVDIGTGYFVEKSGNDAKQIYTKKLAKLDGDSKKLKDILVQKNAIVNNVNMVLRKMLLEQEQQKQ